MKNKLLGVVFVAIVFLPLSLFAEQTDCLDNPCAEAITEDSCWSCGGEWDAEGACRYSCGGSSMITCTENTTDPECTSHEVTSEGDSGSSNYQGGGSTNNSSGSGGGHYAFNRITNSGDSAEGNNNYELEIAEDAKLECRTAVYQSNNSDPAQRLSPSSPPVETSYSDIRACQEYGECIAETYSEVGFVSYYNQLSCAQTTVCAKEFYTYHNASGFVEMSTLTATGTLIETGKYLMGIPSGAYAKQYLAQEDYCDCMDKFGFGKLVQTTCE